jgi:uncharacterized protein (TIGR03067 family)
MTGSVSGAATPLRRLTPTGPATAGAARTKTLRVAPHPLSPCGGSTVIRALLLGWCVVPLLAAAEAPGGDAVKEEMKKLEGTWVVVSAHAAGKEHKEQVGREWVFRGDKVTLPFAGKPATTGDRLDPSREPKALTIETPKSDTNSVFGDAIYEVSGDTLTVCFGTPGSRPTEFSDKGARTLTVLKRK